MFGNAFLRARRALASRPAFSCAIALLSISKAKRTPLLILALAIVFPTTALAQTAPTAPIITTPAEGETTSRYPNFSGIAEPSALITLNVDEATLTTVADGSGTFAAHLNSPLTAGMHTVMAVASNAFGASPPSTLVTFAVAPAPTLALAPSAGALPGGTVGAAYSQTFSASGGTTPYTYAVSGGGLPPGMTLSTGGIFSGTPTTTGTFNFTVSASDRSNAGGPYTIAQVYSLTIAVGTQTISFAMPPAASISASPLTLSATASSGLPVTFASMTTSICTVSGTSLTLLQPGSCSITASQAGNASWQAANNVTQTLTIVAPTLAITSSPVSGPTVGSSYSQDNTASGGVAPYTYTLNAGAFVPGTSLNATTGKVSGTPTVAGTFSYMIRARDAAAPASTADSPIMVVTIGKGSQTINFTSPAPTSASANGATYSVAASANSGLTVSFAIDASATSICSISGSTVSFLAPGTCLINANQPGDSNWNAAAQVQQSFSVIAGQAIGASVNFVPGTIAAGGTGTATITFTNNNAASSPPFSILLTSPSRLTLLGGSQGGNCSFGSAALPGRTSFKFGGVVVPTGGCTLTLRYVGTTAGSSSGFTLSSFTPAGYPTTPLTGSNSVVVVPTVTSISPSSAAAAHTVTITGKGFSTTPAENIVTFGSAGNGTVVEAYPTLLVVTAPVAGSGNQAVTVTVDGQTSTSSVNFTFLGPPTAADKPGVAVPYNGSGTTIDLSTSIAGVHSSIAVGTAPAHGTVTIAGDVVTYTPTSGYFGADSFTYTATGAGGNSTPAVVDLIVQTPPVPVAASSTGSVAGHNGTTSSSVSINLSTLVNGVYDTIQILNGPEHGKLVLGGGTATAAQATPVTPYVATYTPAVNYAGTDSFTYVATGPGGTSSPGTVTITVTGQVPVAAPKIAKTGDGQATSIVLTDGASGGPFTGASVVSVTPADSAKTAIVAIGDGGYRLDVTPNNRYGGTIVVAYTLSNAFGTSATSTVTITVEARPDPRNDPNIAAISDAQAEAARRFARAQVSNFMRRSEQLHHGGGRTGLAMGVTLSSRNPTMAPLRPDNINRDMAVTDRMRISGEDPALEGTGTARDADEYKAAGDTKEQDGHRRTGSVATWVGGAIDIGTRDKNTGRDKITATTAGLSIGTDIKLSENLLVGMGGGYGNDLSKIGTTAQVRGKSTIYAAYASLQPGKNMFVDGMIGLGQLDFTTRRIAATANAVAIGNRDGSYTTGALSLGIDRINGQVQWSLYGRGEYMRAGLKAYAENGADRYNLRFDHRTIESLTGTLGGRIEYRQKTTFGSASPRLRVEWSHEFADVDAQWLDYADIPGAAIYAIAGNGWRREQLQLSLGTRFDLLRSGWTFDLETGLRAAEGERAGTLQFKLNKQF